MELDIELARLVGNIIDEGVRNYRRIEGAFYSDDQLADLLARNQVGDFCFRLFTRFAEYSASNLVSSNEDPESVENVVKENLAEVWVTELLTQLAAHCAEKQVYKHFKIDAPDFGEHVKVEWFFAAAPLVMMAYAPRCLFHHRIQDLWNLMGIDFPGGAANFRDLVLESDPADVQFLAKPLLRDISGNFYIVQVEGIMYALNNMNAKMLPWWFGFCQQVKALQQRMMADTHQKAEVYRLAHKVQVGRYFESYAEDDVIDGMKHSQEIENDINQMLPEGVRVGSVLDEAMLRMQAIMMCAFHARPDSYVSELFVLLDDALEIETKHRQNN